MNLAPYRKTIAAVVTGLIGWATAVVVSPAAAVSAAEWIGLATVLATTVGVYQVPNTPAPPPSPPRKRDAHGRYA